MLESSNFESLNDDAFTATQLMAVNNNNNNNNEVRPHNTTEIIKNLDFQLPAANSNLNATLFKENNIESNEVASQSQQIQCSSQQQQQQQQPQNQLAPTLASVQLAAGVLRIFEPPLIKARAQLKELIGKQNKILIDLSAEKFKWDNADMAKLHEMMLNVKIYKEKLSKIKKQMQNIYQRTQSLKKRAAYIQICKQKELQRKLQKQQHEESLIKHKNSASPSNTN